MRQPEVGEWLEVSISGQVYIPRRVGELPRLARPSTLGNQLTNGTLIDVGGVLLQYQDPIAMAAQKEVFLKPVLNIIFDLIVDYNV